MKEDFIPSDSKPPGRRIWILESRTESPACLLVFLDAELYMERVFAVQVVRRLEDEGKIPPVAAVFVSSVDSRARHADYTCDLNYSRFLIDDLLPFMSGRNVKAGPDHVVLIGLSLSGLAAAHTGLIAGPFRAVICQSPSFWWEQERFASSLPRAGRVAAVFWISVGDRETESHVSHAPSGLFQGTGQRDACERTSAALLASGYTVSERVFAGGHDPACWRDDLALALPWATRRSVT
jgi:enterochelin esterase-like enzyme